MSSTSVTAPAPDASRQLVSLASRSTRDSLLVALSLAVASLSGATVAFALSLIAGGGTSTDATLAAYSLYGIAALLVATSRTALIPLIGSTADRHRFTARAHEVATQTALMALLAAVVVVVLAPVAGPLLTSRLSGHAHRVAAEALVLLAPSVYMQGRAAALSAVMTAAGRISASAAIYVVGGVATLAAAVPMIAVFGPVGAPLASLLGSIVLAVGHDAYLRPFGFRVRVRLGGLRDGAQWLLVSALVSIALVALTMQLQLAISLWGLPGEHGSITAYVYAFYGVFALLSITSVTASLVSLPAYVRTLGHDPERITARYVMRTGTLTLALIVPLLAAAAAFGLPVLSAVFSASLGQGKARLIYELLLVFTPLTLTFAITSITTPVVLARGRERALLLVAAVVLPVQLAGVALLRGDVIAIGCVHGGTGVMLAALVLVVAAGREAPRVTLGLAHDTAPALLLCAPFLTGLLTTSETSPVIAVLGAAACLACYAIVGAFAWPSVFSALPVLSRLAFRRHGR